MLIALSTLLLGVAPPTGYSVSMDRVPLRATGAKPSVEVDALVARITLKDAALTGKAPRLCPTVGRAGRSTVLTCVTRRVWAMVARDSRGWFLDLRELRGLNWADAATRVPMRAWSLRAIAIPEACPGTIPAAKGECSLARGDLVAARAAWNDALVGPDVGLARLRLGDLALQADDVDQAVELYSKVASGGGIGRLAQARLCELLGSCLSAADSARVGMLDGLPWELARELQFFTLRRELAAGRDEAAMTLLVTTLEKDPTFCAGAVLFCQKLIEAGLASQELEARIGALSAFLTPALRRGPLEETLNVAAADAARELGAPGFAAALMAANTPSVPRAKLNAHLLEIARLYAEAGDSVRAEVILLYADGRLGKATQQGAWKNLRERLARGSRGETPVPSLPVDDAALQRLTADISWSTELARAALATSRAAHDDSPFAEPLP